MDVHSFIPVIGNLGFHFLCCYVWLEVYQFYSSLKEPAFDFIDIVFNVSVFNFIYFCSYLYYYFLPSVSFECNLLFVLVS